MLNKEAILQIAAMATAPAAAEELGINSAILIPDGYKTEKLEKYKCKPDFFRAKLKQPLLLIF